LSESSGSSYEQEEIEDQKEEELLNLNIFMTTGMNLDRVEKPPEYYKVCPPTYEESLYYPSVVIKILPDDNYNMDEFKINQTEINEKEEIIDFTNPDIKIDDEEIQEMAECFSNELKDFQSKFNKLNLIFEKTISEIETINKVNVEDKEIEIKGKKEKKSKDFDSKRMQFEKQKIKDAIKRDAECERMKKYVENIYIHNANLFNNEVNYSIQDLNDFKNELCVEISNTKQILNKMINLKK
jgi:hypothetical protein